MFFFFHWFQFIFLFFRKNNFLKVCHFNSLSESDIFMDDELVPGRLSFSGRGRGRRGGYRLLEGVEGEVGAAAGGANL